MQTSFILAGALLATTLVGTAAADSGADCMELAKKSPEACARYLARPRDATVDACVVYAINEIGLRHHVAAASALVQYLDYSRPLPAKLSGATVYERYPAIDALFEIGEPAAVLLVDAISREGTPEIARENAVVTLLSIDREDMVEAVRTLVSASHGAANNASAERLVRAARGAADRCPAKLRTQCMNALSQ